MCEAQQRRPNEREQLPLQAALGALAARVATGPSQRLDGLTIVPLLGPARAGDDDADPRPLAVALAARSVRVEECDSASVGQLRVRNLDQDRWVVGISGEMVCGGRQDRAINASFLLPPAQAAEVPVSCVEQGRWAGGRAFDHGGMVAPSSVRTCLEDSVNTHVTRVSCVRSDQQAVWRTVRQASERARATSSSGALRRVFEGMGRRLRRKSQQFARQPEQSGLAVLRGEELVSIDLFGSPRVYEHYHASLVSAALADDLPSVAPADPATAAEIVRGALRALGEGSVWAECAAVAGGVEIRPVVEGFAVAVLSREGQLVHVGVARSASSAPVRVSCRVQGTALELRVRVREGAAHRVRLGAGRIVIGRSSSCDIKIDEDRVSRTHAALALTADGLAVTDLQSTNGTAVAGEVVDYCRLRPGNVLQLGTGVTIEIVRFSMDCSPGEEPASATAHPAVCAVASSE